MLKHSNLIEQQVDFRLEKFLPPGVRAKMTVIDALYDKSDHGLVGDHSGWEQAAQTIAKLRVLIGDERYEAQSRFHQKIAGYIKIIENLIIP
jgi:hypothetical protein